MSWGIVFRVPPTAEGKPVEVFGPAPPSAERRLRRMFALGRERTIEQDPAFALRILVDIAIRALSPAVDDPTTAVQVSRRLRAALEELDAEVPPRHRAAVEGELCKLERSVAEHSRPIPSGRWRSLATGRASAGPPGRLPRASAAGPRGPP